MASRSGLRCSLVQFSSAVVTSTSGNVASASPRSSERPRASSPTVTTQCSTALPVAATKSARGLMIRSADSAGNRVSRMIRIPAFGKGSRRKCSTNGSSLTSLMVIQTPGAFSIMKTSRVFPESNEISSHVDKVGSVYGKHIANVGVCLTEGSLSSERAPPSGPRQAGVRSALAGPRRSSGRRSEPPEELRSSCQTGSPRRRPAAPSG